MVRWASKEDVRALVYKRMLDAGVALPPFPIYGRIPNFRGAHEAASRLFSLPEWRSAMVVKVNPDSPQRPVRRRALVEGKLLLMPTPRLRRGFLLLDPSAIPRGLYGRASTIRGAFRYGRLLSSLRDILEAVRRVDFIVEGSVAVGLVRGERIGKGEGYGDLEWGVLAELGLVRQDTPIATTVHDLQVFDEPLPQDPHDVAVDIVATPSRLARIPERPPRPRGILRDRLDPAKIEEIPLLRELLGVKG